MVIFEEGLWSHDQVPGILFWVSISDLYYLVPSDLHNCLAYTSCKNTIYSYLMQSVTCKVRSDNIVDAYMAFLHEVYTS